MKKLADIDLWEKPLESDKIPEIDLYMDQLLSLTEEKGITKTMINNYSKEHLIKPLKGKKYSKEQIIQILFIMNLKQNISLGDIKALMPQQDEIDYQKVYDFCAAEDEKLAEAAVNFTKDEVASNDDLSKEEQALASAMMLSSCCKYFRNLCEALIDDLRTEE